jgi:hypothetical protein
MLYSMLGFELLEEGATSTEFNQIRWSLQICWIFYWTETQHHAVSGHKGTVYQMWPLYIGTVQLREGCPGQGHRPTLEGGAGMISWLWNSSPKPMDMTTGLESTGLPSCCKEGPEFLRSGALLGFPAHPNSLPSMRLHTEWLFDLYKNKEILCIC